MTELASETVAAVNELSVHYDARANACAESDDDEVLHAAGYAVSHLADGCSVSVVGERYGDTEFVAEELSQRHYAVASPLEVRSELDGAVVVVAVRSADTHSLDLADAAYLVDDDLQSVYSCVYVSLNVVAISLGLDSCGSLNFTTAVNDTKHRVCASEVQTDYIRFQ